MATETSATRAPAASRAAAAPRGAIAAVGRACFRHRWLLLVIWLAVAAGGFLASGPVSDGLSDQPGANSLESIQASNVLDKESKVGPTIAGEVTGIDPGSAADA